MNVYRKLLPYGVAFGSAAIALLLSLGLAALIHRSSGAFFYIAVAISTWYGGKRPGIVTIVLSTLALAYYLIPPIYHLQISSFEDAVWLALFAVVSLAIHLLTTNLQESKQKIEQLNRQIAEESADRLKVALNAAQMGLWNWDIVTGETNWSPEHEQLFGLSPGTFDGRYETFAACLHPDDRDGLNRAIAHSLQNRVPYQHEFRVVWSDGSLHWIEGRGQAFYNPNGQPVRMSGTIMAIDTRKQAEAALQESETRFRIFMNNSPAAAWITDSTGRVEYVNQTYLDMFQMPSDLVGQNICDLCPPDIAHIRLDYIRAVVQSGQPLKAFEPGIRSNGQPGEFLVCKFPLPQSNGSTHVGGMAIDVTEQKRTEQALQSLHASFHLALSAAEMGTWDLDLINDTAQRNLRHDQIFGYDTLQAEWGHEIAKRHAHPDDLKKFDEGFQQGLRTGDLQFEARIIWPDQSLHWINVIGRVYYDEQHQPVRMAGVVMDVTDRKQAEAALQDKQLQIQRQLAEIETIYQSAPIGLNVLDTELRFVRINQRLADINGVPMEAHIGHTIRELLPDLADAAEQLLRPILETGEPLLNVEITGETPAQPGVQRTWVESFLPLKDGDRIIGISTVCEEITDRKYADQALREREAILQLFARYAPAGIAMFDREMRYIMASQRWVEDYQLGIVESLIGRSHYDLFPELPERWRQIHQRCLAGAVETCEEDLFVWADGFQQWIRWEIRPWYTATGEIGGIIVFAEDITERKQAKASVLQLNQELQQRVTELQTLLDVIPIGIGIAEDPDCHDIRVNPAFAHLLNVSPTVNASLSAPEAERPTQFKIYQKGRELAPEELPLQYAAAYGVEVRDLEVDVVWQDGTIVTLLEYAAPLLDEHGQPRGSVGAFLNITERKRAESDLQRYKDIFQFAEYGLAISAGSRLELVNPAFARLHGYTVEEMINKPILELFPPERHANTIAFIQQLDHDGHLSYESYHVRKDGTVFPILLDITVVKDEEGNPLYRIVTAFDITERKRAEAALRESEARYRTLVQNFPNGAVCLFDPNLRYVLAGGQGLAEIGLDREMLEGKTIWEAFDPETCRLLEPSYRRALAGDAHITEVPYSDRIYRSHLLPLYDDRGRVKLGMSMTQNITLQKQAEQALRTSRDELERQVQERTRELRQLADELQRSNQELEQFAYVASHDLQEPLRAVTSFTQLLSRRYQGQLDAKADTYIEFIVDGASRMQQLIRDLLTYSRAGRYELKRQPIDCNALLEGVKQDLQVTIAETQAMITHDSLPIVTVDATQFKNLLQNLVSNSLKYRREIPPQIHISAQKHILESKTEATAEPVSPSETKAHEEWVFSIQDNGIGIDPQYAERIFGIFQRLHTSDEYSGTGLGLAICKKIIERHGGRIWVESRLGEGATFFFSLPDSMSPQHDILREIT